ncbi:(p)ppGpp synthase/HD superfamily hydrolase [Natronocella acetinitrilica]|uniref:(P)ppGpp synthase/HD superfamily hydrolase n=1 Tax=Natronocella acetinitrilica TaxID=414046 RepID=A0AAE3G3K6_9GAMM|nr:HD domain-containing protein [Natronocella acetinitrilica]MCP1674429.1 (p)ppGpp synthase/HD superfamily hydrolase [Natronocella acetinitrilica]
MREAVLARYNKQLVALRFYLMGRGYHTAARALEYARRHHAGVRKDGFTPEFAHQVEISLYLLTLRSVRDPEVLIAGALLHDVIEDYPVTREALAEEFGASIAGIVYTLSKKHDGKPLHGEHYFENIAACPVASIIKGGDRIHNVQTMGGVFSEDKQRHYLEEVRDHFLPMLKAARYRFTDQALAYFNVEHVLRSQYALLAAALGMPPLIAQNA